MSQGNKGIRKLDKTRFAVRSERAGDDEVVHLVGELDLAMVGRVDREVMRAEDSDAERIVLDLRELEFLDASGIRMLLHLTARSQANGGRLRVTRARLPQVQRVIDLTGASDVLPFVD